VVVPLAQPAESEVLHAHGVRTKLYEESLARFRRFESEEPGGYTADIALTLANLASNDWELGSYATAAKRLEEAHELFAGLDQSQPGVYLPFLARIYARLAGTLLQDSGRKSDREASESAVTAHQRAVSLFEQLEAVQPGSYAHDLALQRANLGGLHVDRGELDLGENELERADAMFGQLEEKAPGAHDPDWAKAHENLGRIGRARGRLEAAHEHWSIALELSEQRRGILSSREGREHYQRSFTSLYRHMVRLCLDLGKPLEAWHFAERGKARGLLDLFADARPKLSSASDRDLFDEWKVAEQEAIRALEPENPGARILPPRSRRTLPRLYRSQRDEAKAAAAFAREEELRLQLQDRVDRSFLQVDVPPPEQLAKALQDLVGGRRVLLLQWVPLFSEDSEEEQPEPIALFVLPLDADLSSRATLEAAFRHTIVELEPGTTLAIVAEFYEILRYRTEAAFERLSDRMGEVMLPVLRAVEELMGAPVAQLGLDALLLVPGRGFQVMPLHAVRLDRQRDRYLLDEAPVFYLGSSHLAGQLTRKLESPQAGRVALMGPPPAVESTPLPEAREEVSRLRRILEDRGFPVRVYEDDDMTIEALKRHSRHLALLHLATHSCFSPDDALKSHVQFCGENLSLDRLLRDPDLDFSGLKLAYLSSCDAGWMEGIWDEEPQSLAYGFLYSGAGAVMASLLPVLDSSARVLAELFYREVADGRPLAEAHREAVRELRRIKGGQFVNPMHWAPMMLHGRGLDQVVPVGGHSRPS
jgi:tetratricopeptide (TPR) repeat protein